MRRPLVAVPGRLSASASALRYAAVVNARALLEAVWRAGGEPLTVLPAADGNAARLAFADAVLLPGGGDLAPETYGQPRSSQHVYDVDPLQDAFDLAVAAWALDSGVPLLAVCRGVQVVNVVLGGSLVQHMDAGHRNHVHTVSLGPGLARDVIGAQVTASCYHHQCVDRLADGLVVTGCAEDGTPEAFERPSAPGWFLGLQWHPEDTAAQDPQQQAVLDALVAVAR